MKKWLGRIYTRVSVRIFGNRIGVVTNLLHYLFGAFLRSISLFKPWNTMRSASDKGMEIRENGYASVSPVLSEQFLSALSEKIDRLIGRPDQVIGTHTAGGILRLKDSFILLPELEVLLTAPELLNAVCSYFSSPFKVYSCDVYRTFPVETPIVEENYSLIWHFDNAPHSMLKLMVYITDTPEDRGALTLVPKHTSAELKRKGFWDRLKMDAFRSTIQEQARTLPGPKGTCLLFTPQYCIHKATLPQKSYRDVAVFLLFPSYEFSRFSSEVRRTLSYNFGYLANPFSGRPLRVGDE
ncbi:MAG: phytanoyl-CoA dioxygenase family protein [Bdellovibrionales bacterium]|nr:phytanoyl-CoA dioxygenase family protein [Bdellovibrionales bacterium]